MTEHRTTDIGAVLNLVDISIARAEGAIEYAADTGDSTRVTERMGRLDELHELRQAILEATATSRRVPRWLLWLCPKVKTPPRMTEPLEDWNSIPDVENSKVWEGFFKN